MPDINVNTVNTANTIKSVGGTSQKNINNNTGRPNRTLENLRQGQNGRIAGAVPDTMTKSSYIEKLNGLKEGFVKTIQTDIIQKALKEAEVEINSATMDIVRSLVNGSLPLTGKNIIDLLEYSHIFQNTSSDVLALMMRLEIPITAENTEQFENLIGESEKLSDKINGLILKFPAEMIQNGQSPAEFAKILSEFTDIIQNQNGAGQKIPVFQPLTTSELESLLNILKELKAPESIIVKIRQINQNGQPGRINMTNEQNNEQNKNNETVQTRIQKNISSFEDPRIMGQIKSGSDDILNIIKDFIKDLTGAGSPIKKEESQNTPQRALFLQQNEAAVFGKIKELINGNAFLKLIKESFEAKWLITPEKLSPENMENYYNKLNENLNRLENLLGRQLRDDQNYPEKQQNPNTKNIQETVAQKYSRNTQQTANTQNSIPKLYHEVQNIRESLNIMNEISKTMPFMQLPVKLSNQTLNGDLYIFSNKKKNKNSKNPAGSINALLRLDLENAGGLDVYINLSGKNVNSRFYSQNERSIREIARLLPELEKSAAKIGFNFKGTVSSGEKGFDFIGDFINRGVPKTEIRKYILNLKI